ncbi:MAG: flagellar hook-length control protein FliK [Gammaproteobacteria bacterium]|nr:flagellar hook-length control protein FliK [Gammaproteobacteria bacterium]
MPSMNNSMSVDKVPLQKKIVDSAKDKDLLAEPAKPFSQHLQDEIQKEIEPPVASKPSQKNKSDTDTTMELGELISSNSGAIEESDLLLTGNELPLAQQQLDHAQQIVSTEDNPLNILGSISDVPATNFPQSTFASVPVADSPSVETESEISTDEGKTKFKEMGDTFIKVEKSVVEGQLNSRTEITVSDAGKTLKIDQAMPQISVNSPDSLRSSGETSSLQSQISTAVNNKQWGAEFSQRISVMLNNGQQQVAELRLNPAQLGPLNIRLQLDDDQANISFITNHQAVKDAIEASLPRLREQLQQQGVELGQVDIEKRSQEGESSGSDFSRASNELATDADDGETAIAEVVSSVNIESGVSVYV